jgi:hypothetical protein
MDESTRNSIISGPYVQVAAFCERVLEEKDGVLTAVRIIDRFTQVRPAPSQSGFIPQPVSAVLLVMLKSGDARGSHELVIEVESPSGIRRPLLSLSVLFEGEDRGVNVIVPLSFHPEEEGLYWFNVQTAYRLLTRMPLRVVFQTLRLQSPDAQGG